MERSKKGVKLLKKLHKWPGLIIAFLFLYFSITGIILNHREWLGRIEMSRSGLPDDYKYTNWNNAALKGSENISPDSLLIYGNIGIWLTDSNMQHFADFNNGLPEGIDYRKIFDVHKTRAGNYYAATLFGLYAKEKADLPWQKIDLNLDIKRTVGIESKGDTVIVINRSYLFAGIDKGLQTEFKKYELEAPAGYLNKTSLFKTLWQIHSGEIFGLPGQLFVDLIGIATFVLSFTGIIFFFTPKAIRERKKRKLNTKKLVALNKWSLKWHNYLGAWLVVFFVIITLTGMFLRPPFLIAIASVDVGKIKFTHLDQPNPWYDKLRDILYDADDEIFYLSTSHGMYTLKEPGDILQVCRYQPPVSVMGITVFEKFTDKTFLIGSFTGLFAWNPQTGMIMDFLTGQPYATPSGGRPVGKNAITGLIRDCKELPYVVDYNMGVFPVFHQTSFPNMPENIRNHSKISLWSLCLEIHTGRFFKFLLGSFYILIVPLTSLIGTMVIISGYFLWRKNFRKKKIPV